MIFLSLCSMDSDTDTPLELCPCPRISDATDEIYETEEVCFMGTENCPNLVHFLIQPF